MGTKVYEAATGELLHSLVDVDGLAIHHCISDPSGKLLVTTGYPGAAFVKDRDSGANLHALDASSLTGGVSFDNAGERLAYWLHGKTDQSNGQVIICDVKDGFSELKRFVIPNLGLSPQLQFSPGCRVPAQQWWLR